MENIQKNRERKKEERRSKKQAEGLKLALGNVDVMAGNTCRRSAFVWRVLNEMVHIQGNMYS